MQRNFIIAPSILSADFTRLGAELAACEAAGADWIHVDVMDGRFVPNLTMGPFIVEACRRAAKLPLDVHLMIEEPERHIEAFAKAGAANITVHVEACPHLNRTIQQIKSLGCNPGFSGQEFLPEVLPKIGELRRALDAIGSSARLEVDGGVSPATLPSVIEQGADVFVSGNFVFKRPQGIAAGIRELRRAIHAA